MKSEEHTGNRAPDDGPNVGTDPQSLPQDGTHKAAVHLDPDAVARHDREEHRPPRSPEEAAREIKNS
jgi:hypothetical protein